MEMVELEIKLPYREKGAVLSRILKEIRGRIRDVHFLPPDHRGISEVRIRISESNPDSLLKKLRKMIKNGGLSFRTLSEA